MNMSIFSILSILLFCIAAYAQQIEFTYGVPEHEIGYYSEPVVYTDSISFIVVRMQGRIEENRP